MEQNIIDKTFIRGFNDGHIIGLYAQEVADQMVESMQTDNDYLFGFKSGLEEGDRERHEQERMDELNSYRQETNENEWENSPKNGLDR